MIAPSSLGSICGPGAAEGLAGLLPVALPLLLLAAYLSGRPRSFARWSETRTACFTLGCLLIALALSPGIASWAAADARGHMVQHLLLGMLAPVALVMGAPMTVLLRSVPVRLARAIVRMLAHPIVRVVSHPFAALVSMTGGMYLMYLTPLGPRLAGDALGHGWMLTHFLVSGTVFAWSIAGPDPAPHRPSYPVRLATLFMAIGLHTLLAVRLGAFPVGLGPHEQEAVAIMLYGGDVAEGLLALLLFHAWRTSRRRRRNAHSA